MTNEQIKKIESAMQETAALIVKWEKRKTFDAYQEAERQANISEYSRHMWKLADMLVA